MSQDLKTILEKVEKMQADMEGLNKKIDDIMAKTVQRIEWSDKVTESDIKLEGCATVARTGVIIGVIPVPTGPGQMAISFLTRRDGDGALAVVDAGGCKFLT